MYTDALLNFVPIGGNLSMVGAAGAPIVLAPGGVALDLLGAGVGEAPPIIFGTSFPTFGTDFGIGVRKPLLAVTVGTAFATGNAATWNLAFQLAADLGAAGNYQPDTWYTAEETGAQAVALAPANAIIARFDWPPAFPSTLRPRYARLLMQVPAGTNLSAGTIAYALVTLDRDDLSIKNAQRNYSVS
jgi:hypothetical protein